MKKILFLCLMTFSLLTQANARPILTEIVDPVGFLAFEGGMALSSRTDRFGPGTRSYRTVNFPVTAKFGFHPKADFGLVLLHTDQHYDHGGVHLSGASTADISTQIKISPWSRLGFQGIWHLSQSENSDEVLSIAHGNDAEFNTLVQIPTPFVQTHFNVGYVWSGNYNSQFGILNGAIYRVKPGNIFQSKLSLEAPIRWGVHGLVESAYYKFGKQKVNGQDIVDSDGEAADALIGITWAPGSWNLGLGASFGLLDEQHTSFNLTRGSGDTTLHFTVAYKLKPHKPQDQ